MRSNRKGPNLVNSNDHKNKIIKGSKTYLSDTQSLDTTHSNQQGKSNDQCIGGH